MIIGTIREIWRYPVKSMAGEKVEACEVAPNGLAGDRGWALRDESTGEIRGGKKWPALLQCHALFLDAQTTGPHRAHVSIRFPDGSTVNSDAADVSTRLSDYLGVPVSLWSVQPASDKVHYRRKQPGASLIRPLLRSKTFRRAVQSIISYTPFDAQLRAQLSREPDEPIPNLVDMSPEILEFATRPGTYFDAFPVQMLSTASLNAMRKINPAADWDVRRFRPNLLIETPPEIEGLPESEWANRRVGIGDLELTCTIPTVRCGVTMHPQTDLPKDPSILRTIVRDAAQNLGIYATVTTKGTVKTGDPVELI